MEYQKSKIILHFALSFCILIFAFCISSRVEAAILYLDSSQDQYHQSQTFIVELRVDAKDECINTIKGDLSFPQDVLEAVDFSQGDSILSIWLEPPDINQTLGLVSFIGGIPGGYCGKLPGEPGRPDLIGKIIFNVKEVNGGQTSVEIEFLNSSQVLLNDGFGTPAKLTLKGMAIKILPGEGEVPESEWEKELKEDTVPPEPFKIEINKDPSVFEGKYFIVFQTQDKQSGIDYYEVKEGKRDWKRTESPYLLEDQSLRSIIKAKAMDKAGNERIAEYLPTYKIAWKDWLYRLILILIGVGIIWRIIRKYKKK